jgi:predicted dehydrogenase
MLGKNFMVGKIAPSLEEQTYLPLRILVIGAGSIGRRHAGNLVALGAEVDLYDINRSLAQYVCADVRCRQIDDMDQALKNNRYSAAIVCTPNNLHIPVAKKVVESSINVFVEKPLSNSRDGVEDLVKGVDKRGLIAMAGFNLRYEPGLQYLKKILNPEKIAFGRLEFGSYLPSWRPGSDYRAIYSANRSMGGGIILDDVHEIDYACWLMGYPEKVTGFSGKFSDLEIDVEDTAELLFQYPDKLVNIHCDYLQRQYFRRCRICLKDGTVFEWNYGEMVRNSDGSGYETYSYKDEFEPNNMYIEEMKEFLSCIKTRKKPESDLENAAKVLDIALQAKGVALE